MSYPPRFPPTRTSASLEAISPATGTQLSPLGELASRASGFGPATSSAATGGGCGGAARPHAIQRKAATPHPKEDRPHPGGLRRRATLSNHPPPFTRTHTHFPSPPHHCCRCHSICCCFFCLSCCHRHCCVCLFISSAGGCPLFSQSAADKDQAKY